ncbi:membrane protein [Stutzerimonas stutzeri]|uniref:Membrane protein n=1 Tax=Stutzerimonas stutzeri TaxID=316 RepID=W8R868_STUST|nr:RDD family protein [Stutzerimonas stutzeri]AHL74507.1 membrane protein [Stutzerimonas stutzeri]MCQ4329034.1 RDD family protein [Stutzerimonas stutzeri]
MPPASTAPLDNTHRVETPEGIDLVLRPAGLVPRAMAFALDLLIRIALFLALAMGLGSLGTFGMGAGALLLFVVQWWYMVLFEVLNEGRTPGKHWLGLKVIHDDGTPIGWASSLTRNLLRFVDMLPFGYFVGAICCLWHPSFKRLGDLAAGTLVVYHERGVVVATLPIVDAIASPFPLELTEQRALIGFAERQPSLSPERRQELAAILATPLQVAPEQAEARLNGIARGLVGPA